MLSSSEVRRKAVEFLIRSSGQLGVSPIVKYTSLSLFADRFLPSLNNTTTTSSRVFKENWLLQSPITESNLHLFALISIWISSKIHNSRSVSVKNLKPLADQLIKDQHFTTRDFIQAEVVFLQLLRFEIGASNIPFVFVEHYFTQFRQLARVGELLDFNACMDVMDLLYESDEMPMLYNSPPFLAAAVLVVSYVITVPKQQWEFPLLPWVKFTTSYEVNDVQELVRSILYHVLKPCNEA